MLAALRVLPGESAEAAGYEYSLAASRLKRFNMIEAVV